MDTNGITVAIVDDLFFISKIKQAAKSGGSKIEIIKGSDFQLKELLTLKPNLLIIDINIRSIDSLELIKSLSSNSEFKNLHTIGYLSHVETDRRREALEAGFNEVYPKSRFSKELPKILESF